MYIYIGGWFFTTLGHILVTSISPEKFTEYFFILLQTNGIEVPLLALILLQTNGTEMPLLVLIFFYTRLHSWRTRQDYGFQWWATSC